MQIRTPTSEETEELLGLTAATEMFRSHEIEALREVLDDYHASMQEYDHCCIAAEEGGDILGFAYYAPAPMTDRTWYLYWIVVRRSHQGRGVGGSLLRHAEDDIRARTGRVLFIETSSLPHYAPTQRFYLKHGYDQEARLRSFYSDGDDMIVFRKAL